MDEKRGEIKSEKSKIKDLYYNISLSLVLIYSSGIIFVLDSCVQYLLLILIAHALLFSRILDKQGQPVDQESL